MTLCAACGQPGHRYGRNEGVDRWDPTACINGLLGKLENPSPADVLRWQGWDTCPDQECRLGYLQDLDGNEVDHLDCAHGMVPPDWILEEARWAAREAAMDGKSYMRAALVAAARKEKP